MQQYDCAIIGGGLGGLALAIQLAKANKNVILFEKENYPFHKVCGEYISMESYNFITQLGIDLTSYPQISQLHISACNGNLIHQKLDLGGFGISRYTLDEKLAHIARKHGVTLLENTKVESLHFEDNLFIIKANQQEYFATLACGAYGKRSNIAIKLQRDNDTKIAQISPQLQKNTSKPTKNSLQNFIGVKYHVAADLPHNLIELHNFKNGYCGISKIDNLPQDKVNKHERFCLCYLTTAQNLKENGNMIEEMEKNVLMKNPFLFRYFSTFEKLYPKPLVISQINFNSRKLIDNHVLMLGDAAGLITPLCGNGMSMALHASKILHELLLAFLANKISRQTLEQHYQQQWHKQFAIRLRAGRVLQQLFGNETMTNVVVATLKHTPFVVKKLISLTHGHDFSSYSAKIE
jgi:flavin-dependent dehydrogenase